ncbi:hypothetical protein TNCV_4339551 [Trichonephila clavipes]|nr:hypothetical protein TNCV_4339551 [Trichonephila clavipes]
MIPSSTVSKVSQTNFMSSLTFCLYPFIAAALRFGFRFYGYENLKPTVTRALFSLFQGGQGLTSTGLSSGCLGRAPKARNELKPALGLIVQNRNYCLQDPHNPIPLGVDFRETRS